MAIFNGYVSLPEGIVMHIFLSRKSNKKQSVVLQKYWGWLVACD